MSSNEESATPGGTRRHLDLRAIREQLDLSQSAFAALLGFSPRTIQSCEQGWRHPSPALEKTALLLLLSHQQGERFPQSLCWEHKQCPQDRRDRCIAFRTRQGHLCWFLTGTLCGGERVHDWEEKRALCLRCSFFQAMLGDCKVLADAECDEPFTCPE